MSVPTAPDATALAGMIRTEIDQTAQAGDEWRVQGIDLQAMYNASPHVTTDALALLYAEGTVRHSGQFWLAVTD